jgi:hypothetical protein
VCGFVLRLRPGEDRAELRAMVARLHLDLATWPILEIPRPRPTGG